MPEPDIRFLVASDGTPLHFRHWRPDTTAQGVVVCLHGIQSHSGWYEYSSRRMAEAGFAVYFADRRGAGLNGNQRGHADHGLRLINDVAQLIRLARRECPDVPVTLLGLSWGGKTAAAFAVLQPHDIDRLALLYPGLTPLIRPSRWQNLLLRFARSHDLRHKPVQIPLQDPQLFTDDRPSQDFIRNDPLALHFVTTGFLNAGRDLDRMLSAAVAQRPRVLTIPPTLLMLAGQDRIIDNTATRRLLAALPTHSLTIREYADARHTLEFDSQRDIIFSDLIEWLTQDIVVPPASRPLSTQ